MSENQKNTLSGRLVLQDEYNKPTAVLPERITAKREGVAGIGRKLVSKLLINC